MIFATNYLKHLLLISSLVFLLPASGLATPTKQSSNDSIQFFVEQNDLLQQKYLFNRYENIISGFAAFTIGNIGYYLSNSPVLKVAYTGIQTIGIINIGKSIYHINSPSIEGSFYHLLSSKEKVQYNSNELAWHLLQIFAQEERAKRIALFYSSSFLALQYSINTFVYESPGNLKNIYIFLSGVNIIVAIYTAFYKGKYEKYYFGNDIDIRPILTPQNSGGGLEIGFQF
ncbi:MAG: hypothetical protein HQK52_20905 [Oligoflexia bacterium]|nr:hypothetical protein [Oligoflexia bacterium]